MNTLVESLEGDEQTGARIVWESLTTPARNIAENAGLEGNVMVRAIESETGSNGLNAATGEIVDLVKAGIIDPAKVTRRGAPERGVDRGAGHHDRGADRRQARAAGRPVVAAWTAWAAWAA